MDKKIQIPDMNESKMVIFPVKAVKDMTLDGIKMKNFDNISIW